MELRRRGALAAFAARGGLAVVASESANWKIDEAHEAAARILARLPQHRAGAAA